MRKIININDNWKFIKENVGYDEAIISKGEKISLPHTWNAEDGQDGGNDYYRGTCWYVKKLDNLSFKKGDCVYLEFRGVNSSSEVWMNGKHLCCHDGGYSTFRVNVTEELSDENYLVVSADNAPNNKVYPQKADFTFYGGIYRDVYLVVVRDVHFDLDYYGSPGIQVTPSIEDKDANVELKAYVTGEADKVRFTVEGVGTTVCDIQAGESIGTIIIEDVHLWNGRKDPYLYAAKAELIVNDEAVDTISTKFGCRTFDFDKDKGFILNGQSYPLRGVSRHQDRIGVGNAITKEMQKEDIGIIAELGANTIRLAHYQHDQHFYDLCDEYGMVVWAEIPYITEHLSEARENTITQMTELVAQNYNHPSIICWGLSNEITVASISDDLIDNHKELNELVHKMDATRPTAMANVFMLDIESPLLDIADINSYNLYYGWYLGELNHNDEWFDKYHEKYPGKVIGLSEYGADACPKWQTSEPDKGDYTEQYQAVYHEHMIRMFEERPYIWATHVWNMFDFAADGRDEGGEHGINQKGLVTFDRKIKKDAFYLYKAYFSDEPFVHICGRRYVDRTEEETEVKVYTNQDRVALYNDGELIEEQIGNKIFTFKVRIKGTHTIEARSGSLSDQININKVAEKNLDYCLMQRGIHNWFEEPGMEEKEGYYSIKDTMGDICKTSEGAVIIDNMMKKLRAERGDVAQSAEKNEVLQKLMMATTIEDLIKRAGGSITPEMVVSLNQQLIKIKKA